MANRSVKFNSAIILNKSDTHGNCPILNAPLPTTTKSTSCYWQQTLPIAPLVVFRITFALMLLISITRFWAKGWIEELYIRPSFFFSYYGFEWVKPWGTNTYVLFAVCAIAALFVALGFFLPHRFPVNVPEFYLYRVDG